MREKINALYAKEAELVENLAIFGINILDNLDIRRLDKDLELLEEIWDLADQWECAWFEYKTASFWNIKPDEMEDLSLTLFR